MNPGRSGRRCWPSSRGIRREGAKKRNPGRRETRGGGMGEAMKRHGPSPLILVVDDDSGTRLLASASLGKAGFATVEAADGDAGLAAFGRFRPALLPRALLQPRT